MEKLKYPEELVLETARITLENARQCVAALAKFGFDAPALEQFAADISVCEALPREISQRERLKAQTRQKDQLLDDSFAWGLDFQNRLELAFGKKSPEYNAFPSQEFQRARKSETQMLGLLNMVIELAEKHQTKLAAVGQTPAVIQQGKDFSLQLREANVAQEVKKEEKSTATQERRQKFMTLYDTVNKINKIGRLVFKADPVKRALFESKWPKSPKNAPPPPEPAA